MNHSAPYTQDTNPIITTQEMTRITLFTAMAVAAAVLARFGSSVVPFSLVPIVVFLAGGILGAKPGAYSMLAYMILGLVGLPVFAGPPYGGFAYVLSPSFGFVPGFVLGAYVVGVVSRWARRRESRRNSTPATQEQKRGYDNVSLTSFIAANAAGILTYNAVGIPYLSLVLNIYLDSPTSIARVLQIGLVPFIVSDLIKAVIAAAIARAVVRAGSAVNHKT